MSHRLLPQNCLLFVCDIQSHFAEKTFGYESVIAAAEAMIKAAKILQIPMIISQSNKRVYSETMPRLFKHLNQLETPFIFKEKFSMIIPEVEQILALHSERRHIILVGMQTHICILQTFLDLKQKNYIVHVLLDAVTSLKQFQKDIGTNISSLETCLFQLLRTAKNIHFRDIMNVLDQYRTG